MKLEDEQEHYNSETGYYKHRNELKYVVSFKYIRLWKDFYQYNLTFVPNLITKLQYNMSYNEIKWIKVASNTTAGYVIMYIQNDVMVFKNVI